MTEERKQVGARLPKSFVANISKLAIDRDISLNDIIERVLVDWYNEQPESSTYGKATTTAKSAPTTTQAAPVEAGSVTNSSQSKAPERGAPKTANK